ncbi:hypothetical protein [Mycobacterium sp. DL99]|uniref:hypothetical protein n=1 Tax=Mycobacterium sp. DL99 TaxID=2528957 RepID=UPI00108108FA|nr:hypothetical protein [Mycobacterium sp. DL99]
MTAAPQGRAASSDGNAAGPVMFGCAFAVAMASGARTPVVVVAPNVMDAEATVGGGGGEWKATGALWSAGVALNHASVATAPPPAIAAILRMLKFISAVTVLSPSFLQLSVV